MSVFKAIINNWFRVDLRTLGIFRFLLGLVCFIDIFRRIKYIEIFYSNYGVAPNFFMSEIGSKYSAKAFTFLSSLGTVNEVTIFFYIGLIASFFFMVGYKTKLFHIITAIAVISIHNRLIILENGGDMVLNSFLIWSLFMPLGKRFSIDRLLSSLDTFKDQTPRSLNSEELRVKGEPDYYWGLSYFACLLQLSIIYFFNYINKDGGTWEQGTSIYYFYQLDHFLTPLGNFIKEFSLMPLFLSKILTHMTIYLEMIIPFLILMPFFVLWTRRFSFITMVGFHVIIGISLYIGTFSWVMIAALMLLLSSKDIDLLKGLLMRVSSGPYIVFYDSDCGFCHQVARILRRLDLFSNLTWAGKDWDGDKPQELPDLSDRSIVVWDKESDQIWIRNIAFSKIISSLPFGFTIAWILRFPGISHLSGFVYDLISAKRTSVSKFLGYAACDIPTDPKEQSLAVLYQRSPLEKLYLLIIESFKTVAVMVLILAALNYAVVKNDGFKDWMKANGYKTFRLNHDLNKISKQTRMIQKWNMFSPNVPRSVTWVIMEATLKDGTVIDLLTGEKPIYDKLSYRDTFSVVDNSQFWRKYLGRVAKNNYKRYRPQLKKTLLSNNNPIKPYDDLNQDGVVDQFDRISSVKLYKLSRSLQSPLIESKSNKAKTVSKYEINLSGQSSNRKSKKK